MSSRLIWSISVLARRIWFRATLFSIAAVATALALAPFSDIALVDVKLRDGATGPRVGHYLASEFGLAVVMVTGNPEAIQTGLLGVVGVISKPVHPPMIGKVLTYLQDIRKGGRGIPPGGLRLLD